MFGLFLIIGSMNMLIAVSLGAFGAHGLQSKLSEKMFNVYQTGVLYHLIHSLGIVIIAVIIAVVGDAGLLKWSGFIMLVGVILFSGSLYVLSISGKKIFGAVTPLGGVCFLVSWLLLAIFGINFI